MVPTHMNNIYGIRINNTTNNGSLNYGNSLHKGYQANTQANEGYLQPGDANYSPLQFNNTNVTSDPDINDQGQTQV
jgi:hypothetical protein